ncbi:MAG: butyrate kinase [Acidobacteria bacterium]|nr:butyrate kinase [Acidobacteriota bacterium]
MRNCRFGKWTETPKDYFFKRYKVLSINPGSTSTKIAYYEGETEKWVEEIRHSAEELKPFAGKPLVEQGTFRKEIILKTLKEKGVKIEELDGIAARGGLLDPISSGTYEINDKMIEHLKSAKNGEHASNLGAIIAKELSEGTKIKCYIVDPVVVDELPERVKITGIKEIRRKSISHALNQIASARRYAEENETFYEKVNLIVCHMGGGISIGAHKKGRYIDVNNALDGEGPFSPERSGSLPVGDLINLCFSGKYTKQELKVLNKGRGGMISLLGTSDLREIEKRILEGDKEAEEAFDAMAYQISKEITSRIPAFDGEEIDQIVLTGGMARSKMLTEKISKYVSPMKCGVTIYAGENEMFALTKGVLRVLSGKVEPKYY